jgi:hypothetical protein
LSPPIDARAAVGPLVGTTIETFSGRPNTVLSVEEGVVRVATERSPEGTAVPLAMVQAGLDALYHQRFVDVDRPSLGYRSAFVAAVLMTLPGVSLEPGTPPRLVLVSGVRRDYRDEVAGAIHAWWDGDPAERFWLEITDRPDIGVDLHAPQRAAGGGRSPGYSLLWWVERGDIVFHYDLNERAITAWSRAVGEVTEAPVVWLSHRAATRRRLGAATAQPGWWLDLQGPFPLPTLLSLAGLRERASIVRGVMDDLEERHGRPIYFPFFFYGGGELRPMQPYLNKLPAALVTALPELAGVDLTSGTEAEAKRPSRTGAEGLGISYRRPEPRGLPDQREPFSVDPAVVERGVSGHVDTQNAVADALFSAGIEPRSPQPAEANFDLAWEKDDAVYVAEVKSITDANEERQLRLGLGQVLRYRSLLQRSHPLVRAVLVAEREPRDHSWRELCSELEVVLVTPDDLTALTK